MKFKAIIFDLDGTLLDTLYDLGNCGNNILKRYEFPIHPIEKYKEFIGDGAKKLVERMIPKEKREDNFIEKVTLEFKEEYGKKCDLYSKPFPDIEKLIRQLKEKQIKISILSNKPHELTMRVVEKLLPVNDFEVIRGHIDGQPRKPDPVVALQIAENMKTDSEKVIFIGDMENDIKTARNGKFYPVAVSWGMRSKKQLIEFGAETIIDKPLDLLKMLE